MSNKVPRPPRNSRYWRERAEEARARAAQMGDESARETMLDIAQGFDGMADRVASREARERGYPN